MRISANLTPAQPRLPLALSAPSGKGTALRRGAAEPAGSARRARRRRGAVRDPREMEILNFKRRLADLRYGARHPWARAGCWACGAAAALALIALAAWWPAQ